MFLNRNSFIKKFVLSLLADHLMLLDVELKLIHLEFFEQIELLLFF